MKLMELKQLSLNNTCLTLMNNFRASRTKHTTFLPKPSQEHKLQTPKTSRVLASKRKEGV
jgi:hypothetical protein